MDFLTFGQSHPKFLRQQRALDRAGLKSDTVTASVSENLANFPNKTDKGEMI